MRIPNLQHLQLMEGLASTSNTLVHSSLYIPMNISEVKLWNESWRPQRLAFNVQLDHSYLSQTRQVKQPSLALRQFCVDIDLLLQQIVRGFLLSQMSGREVLQLPFDCL